jgi:Ca2+-binding RTX toxin-like protein
VSAALGDGDDSAAVGPELGGRLEGGGGNDRLTACIVEGGDGDDAISGCDGFPGTNHELDGGAGDDTLSGGEQNDRLDGGPGHDILRGGGGNDTLSAQEPGALDDFDGGNGQDGLYLYGDADVRVDLVAGTAQYGAAPAGSLASIESVTTGGGNDVLIGDDGPNRLSSGGGEDRVDGGSGDDEITGGSGADVIHGGAGDDAINSFDLYRDSINCGDGADRITSDKADAKTGCETLGAAPTYNFFAGRLRVHGGAVSGSWACSKGLIVVEGVFDSCAARVTLRLRTRGQTFVAGRVSCPRMACSWRLRLNRRARSLLETRSLHGTVELRPIPAHLALPTREPVMVIRGH